jgi:hypothetical protein
MANGGDKPVTYNGDLEHLPASLAPLTEQPRWVCWAWEYRETKAGKGKWTKPPRRPNNPRYHAKSDDPSTWGTYSDAVKAVTAGNADGIGVALLGSGIGAADLDHCRNLETGAIERWAADIAQEASDAYQEVTVSGSGLRVIGTAEGPKAHRRFPFSRDGAGLELYRDAERYITISGAELGSCAGLPPVDVFIDTMLARFGAPPPGARTGFFDFNDAGRQSYLDYDDVIRNGVPNGERSDAFQRCVWHLAAKGWTADHIAEEFARHPHGIGAKYAERLHAEVVRSYEKWASRSRASATGQQTGGSWPQILVVDGELPRVVNEAEDALLGLGREIYQRADFIVRPAQVKLMTTKGQHTEVWRLMEIERPHLVELLTRAGRFLRWDKRSQCWTPIDAPAKIAETYLARKDWRLPILTGVACAPFLRPDGSIVEREGYDQDTGMLVKLDGVRFPTVPVNPSRDDALQALGVLKDIVSTFPWETVDSQGRSPDRSVALSAFLTGLDRRSMATAPLHGFSAPVQGTGKSMLVNGIAVLVTGRRLAVIAPGKTEEELEKRLGAALIQGADLISIDNCVDPLDCVALAQALTEQQLNIRYLGLSKFAWVAVNALIFATGNNLIITGECARRSLKCTIDAHCERPELRSFPETFEERVRIGRPELVVAGLTVLRAWRLARPRERGGWLNPLGSFEDWSRQVREALVWLGEADPCDAMVEANERDPRRLARLAVYTEWEKTLGLRVAYSATDIIKQAYSSQDFYAALAQVAGDLRGQPNARRLTDWLGKTEGVLVGNRVLQFHGRMGGYQLWKLVPV